MIRIIPYILYLLLISFHDVILDDATRIFNASIHLSTLFVFAVALYKSEITATWFGFAVGIVTSAEVPQMMGWHAFLLACLAVLAYQVRQRLNLESIYSRILVIAGGVLVVGLINLLLESFDSFFYLIWGRVLLGTIYTSLVAWIFFMFKDGRITYQKIKAIF